MFIFIPLDVGIASRFKCDIKTKLNYSSQSKTEHSQRSERRFDEKSVKSNAVREQSSSLFDLTFKSLIDHEQWRSGVLFLLRPKEKEVDVILNHHSSTL